MLFTDWSLTDPHYFYIRGTIYGFVAASIFWKIFLPWLLNFVKDRRFKNGK